MACNPKVLTPKPLISPSLECRLEQWSGWEELRAYRLFGRLKSLNSLAAYGFVFTRTGLWTLRLLKSVHFPKVFWISFLHVPRAYELLRIQLFLGFRSLRALWLRTLCAMASSGPKGAGSARGGSLNPRVKGLWFGVYKGYYAGTVRKGPQ